MAYTYLFLYIFFASMDLSMDRWIAKKVNFTILLPKVDLKVHHDQSIGSYFSYFSLPLIISVQKELICSFQEENKCMNQDGPLTLNLAIKKASKLYHKVTFTTIQTKITETKGGKSPNNLSQIFLLFLLLFFPWANGRLIRGRR